MWGKSNKPVSPTVLFQLAQPPQVLYTSQQHSLTYTMKSFTLAATTAVLALTAVLLFHLLFTAQYHYPLAPLNYLLQLAGVLSLLISLIATLYVVLTSSLKDSREWPYMLTYLAKDVPPSSTNATDLVYAPTPWTTAELAAWYAMAATTSGLVQVKYIALLRLLQPTTPFTNTPLGRSRTSNS